MTRSCLFLSLALLALVGCDASSVEAAEPRSQAPAGFWDHWGDGQAEIASYTLSQRRYGELRSGEAVLVTVTETLTAAQRVKSDGGHPDEFPVIKLNEVRDFQTGLYDYNALTSAFLALDGSLPLGLPTGGQWLEILRSGCRVRTRCEDCDGTDPQAHSRTHTSTHMHTPLHK